MAQVIKDNARERLEFNGTLYSGGALEMARFQANLISSAEVLVAQLNSLNKPPPSGRGGSGVASGGAGAGGDAAAADGYKPPPLPTGAEISEQLFKKSSRTRNGADAYFATRELFDPADGRWLLKPRSEPSPPIQIKLGATGKTIHGFISCCSRLGLYREEDLMRCARWSLRWWCLGAGAAN